MQKSKEQNTLYPSVPLQCSWTKGLAHTNISIQKKILEICSERGDEIPADPQGIFNYLAGRTAGLRVNKVGGIVVQSKVAEVFFLRISFKFDCS